MSSAIGDSGSLVGRLSAPGLDVPSGVVVIIRSVGGSTQRQPTSVDGSFVFYELVPGIYTLDVDPSTTPAKYRPADKTTTTVRPRQRTETELTLEPQRSIRGRIYLDVNSDGSFTPGKDVPVGGATLYADGHIAVSDVDGAFHFKDLPSGRTSLIVRWPGLSRTTQVVFDLSPGPVTDRVVNVPLYR